MFKYRKAFIRNDNERYKEFLALAKEGKAKVNSSTIYPYEVIRKLENNVYDCLDNTQEE